MKRYVLDSYAILAYIEGEEAGRLVSEIFKKALRQEAEIQLCVVNWGEVYYIALREGGKSHAESYRDTMAKFPITIIEANKELTLQAATIKAKSKMSYADCFAAGLTKLRKAELVTGDPEFKQIESEIRIHWITQRK